VKKVSSGGVDTSKIDIILLKKYYMKNEELTESEDEGFNG